MTRYPTVHHKRGTSFGLSGTFPVPPGDWTVTANVEKADGTVVTALACAMTALPTLDALGNTAAVAITASAAQTATWPLAALLCDIRFQDAFGSTLASSTFIVNVLSEVTAP